MKLIDKIKKDRIEAMKARDASKKTTLSTLIGECERVSAEMDDASVLQVINKNIKGNTECINESIKNDTNAEERDALTAENVILNTYLPSLLTEDELIVEIDGIIESNNITNIQEMGLVMKAIIAKYPGQIDGKLASDIVKSRLL